MPEGSPRIEQYRNNREKLLALEKEGKYVFHGSPDQLYSLEPKQAYNFNETTKEKEGNPAVFATQYADMAIFRALINEKGFKGESTSRFGVDDNGLHFAASKELLEKAKQTVGKVYVLDKNNFKDFDYIQGRSEHQVVPLYAIEVTAEDLPKNIEVIE